MSTPSANQIVAQKYQLIQQIGSGGETSVYRAVDLCTQIPVAIRFPFKCPPPSSSNWPVIDPYPEEWILAIEHGIDPILGAYQVLELLDGPNLNQKIKSQSLSFPDWIKFVENSLQAVALLHETMGVHGDLNDKNFVLHTTSTNSIWKLLELPFLRFHPDHAQNPYFGQIHVMAPEQFEGLPPSVSTDMYALGCLYYFSLCGHYPHSGKTNAEVAIHHLKFEARDLKEIVPSAPELLCQWVMQLLARHPRDRFSSLLSAQERLKVVLIP